MLGRHCLLVGAGSFLSQHVPWEAFGECALERVWALPVGSWKGYPWGHCFPHVQSAQELRFGVTGECFAAGMGISNFFPF